jgi:hypothetical protein
MLKIKSLQQKVIYVYRHIDVASHEGWLKVGETTRDAQDRVRTQNEADNVKAEILWTIDAVRNNGKSFSDKDIHRLLETKSVEREKKHNTDTNRESEWFKIELEQLKRYIEDYKNCVVNNSDTDEIISYALRREQQEAIDVTKAYYQNSQNDAAIQSEFLWNAKPRFGKTLTSYEFAKSIDAKRIIIVTNRPAIADSWFSDYKKFIKPTTDYTFASSESIAKINPEILKREDIVKQNIVHKPLIYFISLQDIKGQGYSDDFRNEVVWKEKNKWIFELKLPWDLLIIDESHEGVDTAKSFNVLDNLNYKFALHLSGTPFKAIQSAKFNSTQIFNWSYTDEQNAKANWNILDGENPYAALPKLNVFTYQLSRALQLSAEQAKDENSEYAFDLGEFFRVPSDKFTYQTEVNKFLDNLCNPQFEYPFSKHEYIDSLHHTFWLLPGVKECQQMKKLLNEHGFFKDYKIILAAGNGDNDRITKTALSEVKHNIGNNPLETKTITLSCGQLTTGVTVPAWTAVIMLNNCKSPALYMQSAFRSQNPFEVAGQIKTDCYVFDFAPDRVLQTIADFADNMHANSTEQREQKVKMLLNFLPVIAEDDEGKMKELDANEVLTIPLKLITQEVVNRGFMSNRLFENIAGIFGAPKSVMDILEKIKPEENKRLGNAEKNRPTGKVKIWVGRDKKVHIGEDIVVNTSNGLLGDKKYVIAGSDEAKEVQQILTDTKIEMQKEGIPQPAQQVILKELERKMPIVVVKAPDSNNIENLPLPEQPDDKPSKSEKTEEEKVRDRLRGFTRTIPSFLMAYGNADTTLANFEQNIPCTTFKELTNITKEEFTQLRDGFEYEEDGERRCFEGLFNCDVFNASIALFLAKKKELANYFKNDGEDIFDYIPPQETNQIFTSKRVVKMIVDSLQEAHPELFETPETTFCDLYMKSGLFVVETARRLFHGTRSQYSSDHDCITHILEKQVFGFAPTDILYNICANLIFGFDKNNIDKEHLYNTDTLPLCKNKTLNELNTKNNMIFDVIIGNPPYQEMDGGAQASAMPVYHKFIQQSKSLNPRYITMIVPARWFAGGKGLDEFRNEMLNDDRIRILHDFIRADDLFPNVEIKGGVCYFLWDRDNNGLCKIHTHSGGEIISISERSLLEKDAETFVRYNEAISILRKVQANHEKSFSSIVRPAMTFGFRTFFKQFDSDTAQNNFVKVYANRSVGYIKREKVTQSKEWIDKWKVIVPEATGVGNMQADKLKPIISEPNSINTETYIMNGPYNSKTECENVCSYINTKFFHLLLGLKKITQHTTSGTYSFIPLQDFSESWTDEKLYKKYGLTKAEIEFIESMIRPMAGNDTEIIEEG